MQAQDIYVRLTDPSGKCKDIVSHHRVWDRARFLGTLAREFATKKGTADCRLVSVASEADYRQFMGYRETQP